MGNCGDRRLSLAVDDDDVEMGIGLDIGLFCGELLLMAVREVEDNQLFAMESLNRGVNDGETRQTCVFATVCYQSVAEKAQKILQGVVRGCDVL